MVKVVVVGVVIVVVISISFVYTRCFKVVSLLFELSVSLLKSILSAGKLTAGFRFPVSGFRETGNSDFLLIRHHHHHCSNIKKIITLDSVWDSCSNRCEGEREREIITRIK
jgi:hypothetical protein